MDAKRNVNIYFHVIILFTFLTIFFFTYLSKVQKKAISDSVTSNIQPQINNLLSEVDYLDKKLSPKTYPTIQWNKVEDMGENIKKPDPEITNSINSNNKKLLYISIAVIASLIVGLVILIIYYKSRGETFSIWGIVLENLVIFSFVGVIEFLFFKYVASKYIPTTPYNVSSTILDRINYNIQS
jgi:hypothetical protein